MNTRAIIKKVIKRRNKYNKYYGWVRIILPNKLLLKDIEKYIWIWVNWWQYKDSFSSCFVLNMKQRYIKYDLKQLINNLNKSWLPYKLR